MGMATKLLGLRAGHRPLRDDDQGWGGGEPLAIVAPNQPQAVFAARTGDIRIHENVQGSQWEPVIASLTGGGYAVAWFEGGTGSDKIYLRFFDNAGVAQGQEILVATGIGQNGEVTFSGEDIFDIRLSIASTSDGGVVLAWVDHDVALNFDPQLPTYTGESHVFAQRVSATGSLTGGKIEVAEAPVAGSPVYMNPSVAALPGGGFLVTYEDDSATADRVFTGRLYDAGGNGGTPFAFAAVADTLGQLGEHSIATLLDGRLAVVWDERLYANEATSLHVQFVSAGGAGATFAIDTMGRVYDPAVAALTGGGFVVTWTGNISDQTDVYAQVFDASGSPEAGAFSVTAYVP